jgi:hypothetical protein
VIRALIILECVLLIIVALDKVVGVTPSSGMIERAGRERNIIRDGQVGSIRAAIAPLASARQDVPQSIAPNELMHPKPPATPAPITPTGLSIVSTALSQTPPPTASPATHSGRANQ